MTYQSVLKEVDSWVDGLGLGIDEGIKHAVVVFNLAGFPTYGSCEGHLDWGCHYPWIDFECNRFEFARLNKYLFDFNQNRKAKAVRLWKSEPDELLVGTTTYNTDTYSIGNRSFRSKELKLSRDIRLCCYPTLGDFGVKEQDALRYCKDEMNEFVGFVFRNQ